MEKLASSDRPTDYPHDTPVNNIKPVIHVNTRPETREEKKARKKLEKHLKEEKKFHKKEKEALKQAQQHHHNAGNTHAHFHSSIVFVMFVCVLLPIVRSDDSKFTHNLRTSAICVLCDMTIILGTIVTKFICRTRRNASRMGRERKKKTTTRAQF